VCQPRPQLVNSRWSLWTSVVNEFADPA